MKQFTIPSYTFTPGASGVGTVNLFGISGFNVKYLVAVINQTRGVVIYSTGDAATRYTNLAGTTLTLNVDTSTHNSGDVLQVIYEVTAADPLTDTQLRASAVPVTPGALVAGSALIGDVGTQYRGSATGAASGAHLISAATTNATIVKGSAGRVLGWALANTNAAWRYVKLHNQITTPTAGTGVVRTIAIPPNGLAQMKLESGIAFATGIGLTTVTGSADADTTAVGVGDIVGDIFFA